MQDWLERRTLWQIGLFIFVLWIIAQVMVGDS
jgi:hypothetical protein